MPKDLPEDWINGKLHSLKVSDLVRNAPERLKIFRTQSYRQTKHLECRWLPMPASIDIRPNQGRNSSGKRMPYKASTGFEDPYQAAKAAVRWWEELQEDIDKKKNIQKYNSQYSLHHYWEKWFSNWSANPRLSKNNIRNRKNQWTGEGWGLMHQKWSLKSIDEITRDDIAGYFQFLDARGDGTKGSMEQPKKNQKSLLNKLNKEAFETDFPNLRPFIFPVIESKPEVQKEHFLQPEWEKLMKKINELSGGVANKELTKQEYENLDFSDRDRDNQRNWVDLYDCLQLLFYFFLRSEDIPRIRTENFKDMSDFNDDGDPKIFVYLENTKKDRLKQETEHFYPTGYEVWKRIEKRRPSGYISFPHYPRVKGDEKESNVGETANYLIKKAAKLCKIKKRGAITLTTIRHTAFRLTLEDMPPLVDEQRIKWFADNGNTSEVSFKKTYLKYEQRSSFASEMRKQMPKHTWAFFRGTKFVEDE